MQFDPSRRLFLRRGGIAAIAPVVAPMLPIEKIVKYFFAPTGGWGDGGVPLEMHGPFLDVDWVTMQTLKILHKNLRFEASLNREFEATFGRNFIASPLVVRLPTRYAAALQAPPDAKA